MAAFLAMFAADVFGMGYTFWQSAGAFLIHLLPALLVTAAVVIAWRWELGGAVIFFGLSVLYVMISWGRFPPVTYLVVSGPLLVTGGLFLVSWMLQRRRLRRLSGAARD